MKKYFVAFTMIFVLILSLYAFATEEEFCATSVADKLPSYMPDVSDDADLFAETVDIYTHLFENMMSFSTKINISSYGLTVNDLDKLNGYFGNTLLMNHELYYVDFEYTYWYNSRGNITAVTPEYHTTDKTEIANTIAQMDEVFAGLLSKVDDSMTDLEKVIIFYDEVILMTRYDHSLEKNTPKHLLLEGITVCQGYASVIYELCERSGIPCGLIRSTQMNHVWNAFYIDGEWYHADATWDDANPHNSSRATHTYFMKSNDYYLGSAGHYDFTPLESDSKKYDDYFWNEATSKMLFISDQIFFISGKDMNGGICIYNPETQMVKELYEFPTVWFSNENSTSCWVATFSGLEYDKGRLFFNTDSSIMSCKLDGTDVRVEFSPSITSKESVYGCFKKDGKLAYSVGPRNSVNTDQALYLIDFPENNAVPFYMVDTYKKDGETYLSYINDTNETFSVFAIFKNGGRFDHAEIIPVTVNDGKVLLPSSDKEYEIVILSPVFSPLADKKSIQP